MNRGTWPSRGDCGSEWRGCAEVGERGFTWDCGGEWKGWERGALHGTVGVSRGDLLKGEKRALLGTGVEWRDCDGGGERDAERCEV